MLTPEILLAELMTGVMSANGEGFTVTKELGTYQTRSERTEAGWRTVPDSSLQYINSATEAVREVGEQYPELEIRFPQRVLDEQQPVGQDDIRTSTMLANAEITVPAEFVQKHSGTAFRTLLADEWQSQTTELCSLIAKRLMKHEFRTARMFGTGSTVTAVLRITADTAETDIWVLPLESCGFFPLQWDGEICGLALHLSEKLRETLLSECGETLRIRAMRSEQKQLCLLTVSFEEDLD